MSGKSYSANGRLRPKDLKMLARLKTPDGGRFVISPIPGPKYKLIDRQRNITVGVYATEAEAKRARLELMSRDGDQEQGSEG